MGREMVEMRADRENMFPSLSPARRCLPAADVPSQRFPATQGNFVLISGIMRNRRSGHTGGEKGEHILQLLSPHNLQIVWTHNARKKKDKAREAFVRARVLGSMLRMVAMPADVTDEYARPVPELVSRK
jgi:hypothetical protein